MPVWYREDPTENFSLKDLFYLNRAKIEVLKMIFHVFFVLQKLLTRENRTNYLHFS